MNDSASFPLSGDNQERDILPDLMAAANFGASESSQEFSKDDRETIQELSQETTGSLAEAAAEAARVLGGEPIGKPDPREESAAGQTEVRPERRRRRRAMISAQVRVRALDVTCGGPDEISTTLDVSRAGFLFLTNHAGYHRGMDVMLTFPYSSAPSAVQAEQCGRVARVSEMGDGRLAVAIAIGAAKEDLVDSGGRVLVNEPLRELSAPEPQPKKLLVLAVDADPILRESLKNYLTSEGYEVIAVETAADAREVLNMFTPSVVLAEIEGEGLPGYDLCAHVKSTPRLQHIPVVLMTSSAYPSDYSSAHSLGAVVCMAKPFKQERLGHVVRLLAPPPQAQNAATPPRAADPSRRAGARRSKPTKPGRPGGVRGFRILPQ
jgi:two-component system, cell cycle response regulator DivK